MTKDTGGQAFPSEEYNPRVVGNKTEHKGMTLWDYFAGQAIIAVMAKDANCDPKTAKDYSKVSYAIADAMIAERSKQ